MGSLAWSAGVRRHGGLTQLSPESSDLNQADARTDHHEKQCADSQSAEQQGLLTRDPAKLNKLLGPLLNVAQIFRRLGLANTLVAARGGAHQHRLGSGNGKVKEYRGAKK